MLNEISGITGAQIICIQDTAAEPGRFLLRELASKATNSNIHIVCYDHLSTLLKAELNSLGKTVHLHDCLPPLTPNPGKEDGLDKFVKTMQNEHTGQFIIIDSFSTLFLQEPMHVVYQRLRQLLSCLGNVPRTRIVLILHEDTLLNPKPIIAHLKLVCNVWIRIQQGCRANIAVRKSYGKITVETYKYDNSESPNVVWHKEENVDAPNKSVSNGTPKSTFKLTLSENEKKERDAVKLPYERHDDDEEPGSSATITYEPDEFDDWDEEDPDNDLEFS